MTSDMESFFKRLDALDNGKRAALRRSYGIHLTKATGNALVAFYQCLPKGVPASMEDRWFTIACLRCLWDRGDDEKKPKRFEQIIAEMGKQDDVSASMLHRLSLLLDVPWNSDAYLMGKLTRMIKMIRGKSERAFVDFPALLDDLLCWNADDQYVQRRWARTVYIELNEKK